VPFAVSQKGIAEGIDIRVTHIPRAVQKLLDDNFITEFKTHFRGHLRKRKAYFLTERGTEKATALKESVGAQTISLKTNEGKMIEKPMLDMYDGYGRKMSFFEFYILYNKNGILEEAVLENYSSTMGEAGRPFGEDYKDFSRNIPEHAEVLGRDSELDKIGSWLESPENRVLIITGDQGIGKSAVAAEAVRSIQEECNIFWLNFQKGKTWEALIHALAELASSNNFVKLEKHLKQAGSIVPGKAFEIIGDEMGDFDLLVALDNVHNIEDGTKTMGDWLMPLLKYLPGWKILMTSREPLPVELRSSNELENRYTEVKLTGLDSATSRELLKVDLTESEFESIYNYTEGNPLYLKAIRDMEASGKINLKNFRPEELSLLKFLKITEELD
jgi:chloramphenicol 3-O-phosphotransferase